MIMHNYEFKFNVAADTRRPPPARSRDLARHHRAAATRPRVPAHPPRPVPGRGRAPAPADLQPSAGARRWIDELKLCAEYGISRTPLREALKVLAVEGLVTMKVRRGAYVTEMSRDDVAQVYHLLALLESDAAGEVAAMPPTPSAPTCRPCMTGWRSRCASATPSSTPTSSSTCAARPGGQPLARADRDGPAQGDEAQPPPCRCSSRAGWPIRWPSTAR
jgi:hypothetical protein